MYVFFFCNSSFATLSLSLQDMRNILLINLDAEVQGDPGKVFLPAALFVVYTSWTKNPVKSAILTSLLGLFVFPTWEHMSLGICVSPTWEHISLGICISPTWEQISLGMCLSYMGTHVTRDMCFPYPGKHIARDKCLPYVGTNIPRDITRDMYFPYLGTNITRDVSLLHGNTCH